MLLREGSTFISMFFPFINLARKRVSEFITAVSASMSLEEYIGPSALLLQSRLEEETMTTSLNKNVPSLVPSHLSVILCPLSFATDIPPRSVAMLVSPSILSVMLTSPIGR